MSKAPWEGMGGYTNIDSETLPMINEETPTFMGVPYARGAEELQGVDVAIIGAPYVCLLYTSPSPRDVEESRMPSSA